MNNQSRGTTLVQPPVARTALEASNKAAVGNGTRRSVLLALIQTDGSGTSDTQGSHTPVRTNHRF
ncbi:MAG: hypothetical protein AAGU02_00565, partial [Lawsonibacter sp.]